MDTCDQALFEQELNIIDQSPYMVIITNTSGKIEYINPMVTETLGYEREEVIGKDQSLFYAEKYSDKFFDYILNTVLNGETWQGELYNKKKNGEFLWEAVVVSPIRNAENNITHLLFTKIDINYQKYMEKEIQRINSELDETIKKLILTQGQLIQKEKLAGIGQLAAGVAHEINNPLGFVLSNFDTLKQYLLKMKELMTSYQSLKRHFSNIEEFRPLPDIQALDKLEKKYHVDFIIEDIEDLLKDSKEGLDRVSEIVKSLRIFSRVDQLEQVEEYDLNTGIKNTLIIARNEIKYHAVVEEDLQSIPTIHANGGQINQVLLNIIINGVQAIKERHGDEMGILKISTYADETFIRCKIEDNGIGMPPEVADKIFDPFFTTKSVGEGTGLGLSIAYDIIVTKHNGKIQVDSHLGQGTTFIIEFPIVHHAGDIEKGV